MTSIDYKVIYCEVDDLERQLIAAGQDCWRVCSSEPVPTIGPNGSGIPWVIVILDHVCFDEEPQEPATEGMAMGG